MKTKIFHDPKKDDIRQIGKALAEGQLVALPTETVYGLGANGLSTIAMDKIYRVKGRPSDNPLILHVANQKMVEDLVTAITPTAKALMDAFWPGPLTITLPKSLLVPDRATGGLSKVALRCPAHELCRQIIEAAEIPVAAPSANLSGKPSPTSWHQVYADLKGSIWGVVDGGPCAVGIESTVVDVHDDKVTILRPGQITEAMLLQVVGSVLWDQGLHDINTSPKAPGMKYKHYAPNAPMTTFIGSVDAIVQCFYEKGQALLMNPIKLAKAHPLIGLFIAKEVNDALHDLWYKSAVDLPFDSLFKVYEYGVVDDLESLAYHLYDGLITFNDSSVQEIWAQGTSNDGLGKAIMNRMEKASNHRIIYVE